MKKRSYATVVGMVVAGGIYALISWGMGPEASLLGKLFLTFFAGLIVMQIIPAVLLFGCMLKAIFTPAERDQARSSLADSSVDG